MTTRTPRRALTLGLFAFAALASCRAETLSFTTEAVSSIACGNGGTPAGAAPPGTPCLLDQENDPKFVGASKGELSVESCPGQPSGAPVCIAYYFQGRQSCPYGQDASGQPPPGAAPCKTPSGVPVVGAVPPQCVDRPASRTVFWSCRCANDQGSRNDGESYCTCPDSTECAPALTPAAAAIDSNLNGSYCIPHDLLAPVTCSAVCDPNEHPCP